MATEDEVSEPRTAGWKSRPMRSGKPLPSLRKSGGGLLFPHPSRNRRGERRLHLSKDTGPGFWRDGVTSRWRAFVGSLFFHPAGQQEYDTLLRQTITALHPGRCDRDLDDAAWPVSASAVAALPMAYLLEKVRRWERHCGVVLFSPSRTDLPPGSSTEPAP